MEKVGVEQVGSTKIEKLSEAKFYVEWCFEQICFDKPYFSTIFHLDNDLIPYFQLAIVSNKAHHVVEFLLFLWKFGWRQAGQKVTVGTQFSCEDHWCFRFSLGAVDCLELKPVMKIYEVNSLHPILTKHNFKFNVCFTLHSKHLADQTKKIECSKGLIQDLRLLYTSGDMHDLKFCIGEDVLRAHELLLCARSAVFKKMMEHDCVESLSNTITITDCSVPLFQKFLWYLYTDEIEDTTVDTVVTLYSLGDKYDVPVLKKSCSNILKSKFTSESVDDISNIVCNILQLSVSYNDSELKDLAVNFIVNNFPTVSDKESWKNLMKNNFELTSNILALVARGLHKQVYNTTETK